MKLKLFKPKNKLFHLFILIPVLLLTLSALTQTQQIKQFAQTATQSATQKLTQPPPPPLYGCLQVGEGTNKNCASLQVKTEMNLTVHGRPINGKTVWYGDTITGSIKYTNVGDVPINIQKATITGGPIDGEYRVDFKPSQGPRTLNPGESIDIPAVSHRFGHPDPGGKWKITAKLTDTNGQTVEDIENIRITVNTSCTVLRIKDLTEKDKSNLRKYCSNHPNTKLCNSQQYCEVVGNGQCEKTIPDENKPSFQCDPHIIVSVIQQDLFEEICNDSPNTDMCKSYCYQTIGSPICMEEIQVPVQVPVTIRVAKASNNTNEHVYPQQALVDSQKEVAGVKIARTVCSGGGITTNICTEVPDPPAPKAAAAIPKVAAPKPLATGQVGANVNAKASAPATNGIVAAISRIVAPVFKTVMQTVIQTIRQAFVIPFTRNSCQEKNPTDCCAYGAKRSADGTCKEGTAPSSKIFIQSSADIAAKHEQSNGWLCNVVGIGCPIAGTPHIKGPVTKGDQKLGLNTPYVIRGGNKIVSTCPGVSQPIGNGQCGENSIPIPGVYLAPKGYTDIKLLPHTGGQDGNCKTPDKNDSTICTECRAGTSKMSSTLGLCEGPAITRQESSPPVQPEIGRGGQVVVRVPAAQAPDPRAATQLTPVDPAKGGQVVTRSNPSSSTTTNLPTTSTGSGHNLILPPTMTREEQKLTKQELEQRILEETLNEEQKRLQEEITSLTNRLKKSDEEVPPEEKASIPQQIAFLEASKVIAAQPACFSKVESQSCGSCTVSKNSGVCCRFAGNLVNNRCPRQATGCGDDIECSFNLPAGLKSTCLKLGGSSRGTCTTPQGLPEATQGFGNVTEALGIIKALAPNNPPPAAPVVPAAQIQPIANPPAANAPQNVSQAEISNMQRAWKPILPPTNGNCEKGYTIQPDGQCYFTPKNITGGGLVTGLESTVRCQNPSNCLSGVCAKDPQAQAVYRCQ